ncbi:hypothetical protein MNBD_GAMMA26-1836 [hydrothermal vent metagenome]|uniref:Response regulator NasT n=1 Tax=hydrothermal vent metagenome TaxID=652676 RepID=A0A3B1B4E6_9ZZZZ
MAKKHLLLADDDEIILALFGKGLRNAGYDVSVAASGEAALKIVAAEQIDLAILDVDMPPGMSGIETANQMRDFEVPVIFLSAYDGSQIVQAALAEGALGYVIKPIDVQNIIPTIETALERANELKSSKVTEKQLDVTLDKSKAVNIAVGVVMERCRKNQDEAFEILRLQARAEKRKVHEIAEKMINALELINTIGSK